MSIAKDIFKKHQAQTFPFPSCLEVESAKGSYITDVNGKAYLDFVAGVSSCTLGHSNPIIINAVKEQLDKYTHVMVYGEYVQSPQYKLAQLLAKNLPENREISIVATKCSNSRALKTLGSDASTGWSLQSCSPMTTAVIVPKR